MTSSVLRSAPPSSAEISLRAPSSAPSRRNSSVLPSAPPSVREVLLRPISVEEKRRIRRRKISLLISVLSSLPLLYVLLYAFAFSVGRG
jgi:hypothetical protein